MNEEKIDVQYALDFEDDNSNKTRIYIRRTFSEALLVSRELERQGFVPLFITEMIADPKTMVYADTFKGALSAEGEKLLVGERWRKHLDDIAKALLLV